MGMGFYYGLVLQQIEDGGPGYWGQEGLEGTYKKPLWNTDRSVGRGILLLIQLFRATGTAQGRWQYDTYAQRRQSELLLRPAH